MKGERRLQRAADGNPSTFAPEPTCISSGMKSSYVEFHSSPGRSKDSEVWIKVSSVS